MCRICDGATADEVLCDIHFEVVVNGFTQVPVAGDDHSWTYTIGLAARGHAELVMAGVRLDHPIEVVDRLATRVLAGERFDGDEGCVIDDDDVLVVRAVHPSHFEQGLLAMWDAYYDTRPDPPRLTALQIVPAAWLGEGHADSPPPLHLSPPHRRGRPNREARRRRARRRRAGHGWPSRAADAPVLGAWRGPLELTHI
ncbi:MAG: DUF4262 domain-containing protein [Acidimicrobiales bacterium]